jgi:carboxyl-terminal processing protease
MSKKTVPVFAVCVIVSASLVGGYVRSRPTPKKVKIHENIPDSRSFGFEEALATVQENYAGSPDLELLGKGSIQGMLHQLDPHSSFFTKDEFDELQTEQRSRIYGIGVTIAKRLDRVCITSVTSGGPAYRAGLRYGDAVIGIDGQDVEEWSSEQVMHRVRGERGEPVEITIERPGAPGPITFSLQRDEVKLPSVRNYFMLDKSETGYIALTGGFSARTDEELLEALARLKKEGMRQLILDLRGNPGGLLDQAVEVAKTFLAPGEKIVEVRGREDRIPEKTYLVPDTNEPETIPMVLLINRWTASASEVVAGALQDHDRALVVGESSFGKGLVQSVTRVWGGAGLLLTTQKYYTPTGRSIQRDYSHVSFYDYYLNRHATQGLTARVSRGDALQTPLGRMVYGGGGIEPDVEVKSPESNPVRARLSSAAFDFVRGLVAGQLPGLREYRVVETQYKEKVTQEDVDRFPVNDKVLAAFRQHISAKPELTVSDEQFSSNLSYIKGQLRREIITAAYGAEGGEQTYLSDDIQLRKAIESLDQARMLAENARRARNERQ